MPQNTLSENTSAGWLLSASPQQGRTLVSGSKYNITGLVGENQKSQINCPKTRLIHQNTQGEHHVDDMHVKTCAS